MTRQRLAPIRDQPDQRGGAIHPTAQAARLVRGWLSRGPTTHRTLERLAADRGVSSTRLVEALAALHSRGEIKPAPGQTAERTWQLTRGTQC